MTAPSRAYHRPVSRTEAAPLIHLLEALLRTQVWGNTLALWGRAAIVLLLAAALLAGAQALTKRIAHAKLAKNPSVWRRTLVRLARSLRFWLLLPAVVTLAAATLRLPPGLHRAIEIAAIAGLALQAVIAGSVLAAAAVDLVLARYRAQDGEPDPGVASMAGVLRFVAVAAVAVLVLLVALDNMGVAITPMLTGLGIGGIAVALAVQNILSDLFGSLTIILDKPFVVGDFIVVGDHMGTVERIGIKTTRVRALSGEQLVFANSDLLASRVQNFQRMRERRVEFRFGVAGDTPRRLAASIPAVVEHEIRALEGVRFERAHFKGFGEYSLDFEVVYHILDRDFARYMDTQQAINLAIMDRFEHMGVEFATPTQVHINRRIAPARRAQVDAD